VPFRGREELDALGAAPTAKLHLMILDVIMPELSGMSLPFV
jgi:YesN/AraC family two-component response regulator